MICKHCKHEDNFSVVFVYQAEKIVCENCNEICKDRDPDVDDLKNHSAGYYFQYCFEPRIKMLLQTKKYNPKNKQLHYHLI